MKHRRAFPATRASVTSARRFVLESLTVAETDRAEIAVMVSELAANAVLHAGTDFVVQVLQDDARSSVRVEVTDHGPGEPTRKSVAARTRGGGRGLHVVATLADDWGTTRDAVRGTKTVWFERALTPARDAAGGHDVTTTGSLP